MHGAYLHLPCCHTSIIILHRRADASPLWVVCLVETLFTRRLPKFALIYPRYRRSANIRALSEQVPTAMTTTPVSGPASRVSQSLVIVGALCFSLGFCARSLTCRGRGTATSPTTSGVTKSPLHLLGGLSDDEIRSLPYPPDALPGGRQVETPYGSIQVYEWGPASGEKVLLLPGIGTPILALGDMAGELTRRGFRVMMFGTSSQAVRLHLFA